VIIAPQEVEAIIVAAKKVERRVPQGFETGGVVLGIRRKEAPYPAFVLPVEAGYALPREPPFRVEMVALTRGLVPTASGLPVQAHASIGEVGRTESRHHPFRHGRQR
jgi:hypothetical protein